MWIFGPLPQGGHKKFGIKCVFLLTQTVHVNQLCANPNPDSRAFLAGLGFRPQKAGSGFRFEKNKFDTDSRGLLWPVGFKSRFGFKLLGFRFKKIEDSGGFGFSWIRIRGSWILIRIRIRDAQMSKWLISSKFLLSTKPVHFVLWNFTEILARWDTC